MDINEKIIIYSKEEKQIGFKIEIPMYLTLREEYFSNIYKMMSIGKLVEAINKLRLKENDGVLTDYPYGVTIRDNDQILYIDPVNYLKFKNKYKIKNIDNIFTKAYFKSFYTRIKIERIKYILSFLKENFDFNYDNDKDPSNSVILNIFKIIQDNGGQIGYSDDQKSTYTKEDIKNFLNISLLNKTYENVSFKNIFNVDFLVKEMINNTYQALFKEYIKKHPLY